MCNFNCIKDLEKYLSGGDLRSAGKSAALLTKIKTQEDFDELFAFLFSDDRLMALRAADVAEKLSVSHPQFLESHKADLFVLCGIAVNKELKWHLAQMIIRLPLNIGERDKAANILRNWILDKKNSRIVRVNALQSFYDLTAESAPGDIKRIFALLEKENISSINARIRLLRKRLLAIE